MGAIDRFLRRNRGQDNIKPLMKRLESAMLSAVKAAGGAAWYVPDDFLTLGPELSPNPGAPFVDASGITSFTSGALSVVNGMLRSGTTAGASQPMIANFAIPTTIGKTYKISVPRANKTTNVGVFNLQASNNSTGSGSFASVTYGAFGSATTGLMEFVFTATAATTYVGLRADNGASGTSADYSEWGGCSVREILSAKDFQDSAGTLPSYFGGTVGLALDATGTAAAELVADVDLNDPSNWNLAAVSPATSTIAGGRVRIYSPAGENASAIQAFSRGVATLGKLYKFTIDVEAYTGQAGVHFAGSGAVLIPAGVGVKTVYAVADGAQFGVKRTGACDITINSISVKEITGNVVTQATAANRPTVSRIPRKLGPELAVNGDFSSGASSWGTNGSTVNTSAGDCAVTVSTTTGRIEQSVSGKIQAGKTYYVTADIKSGSGISSRLNVIRSAIGGYAAIAVAPVVPAATNAINSVVFTAPADDAIVQVVNASGLTSGTFVCDNVSVREVLEWSYALTFDGSNDSLAAPASIIGSNLSQPYTMIQAFRAGQVGVGQRIQGDTGRWAAIGSTNKLVVTHQGSTFVAGVSDTALGELLISEVTWDGTTAKIWKNGVLDGQGALAAPSGVTPSAHNIGQNGGNASYFKGDLVYSCVCPAVMTEAQRAAVRKFAAAQMGLSL